MLDVGYYLIMIGSIVAGVGLCFCMIGFGCNGVSSNSYASSYQSIIGNVSRGSCFSLLYSFGMKGLFCMMIIFGGLTAIYGIKMKLE